MILNITSERHYLLTVIFSLHQTSLLLLNSHLYLLFTKLEPHYLPIPKPTKNSSHVSHGTFSQLWGHGGELIFLSSTGRHRLRQRHNFAAGPIQGRRRRQGGCGRRVHGERGGRSL